MTHSRPSHMVTWNHINDCLLMRFSLCFSIEFSFILYSFSILFCHSFYLLQPFHRFVELIIWHAFIIISVLLVGYSLWANDFFPLSSHWHWWWHAHHKLMTTTVISSCDNFLLFCFLWKLLFRQLPWKILHNPVCITIFRFSQREFNELGNLITELISRFGYSDEI